MAAVGTRRGHDGGVGDGGAVIAADSAGQAGRDGDDQHFAFRECVAHDGDQNGEGSPARAGGKGQEHRHQEDDHRQQILQRRSGAAQQVGHIILGTQQAGHAGQGPGQREDEHGADHGLEALRDAGRKVLEGHDAAHPVEHEGEQQRNAAAHHKAGGSAAFGRWASTHIHTRAGAQFATLILGMLIFVDDYFNCLTVGSVMRPVTDRQKVSRAKLAYLIDSTAAPICIIAPVSSWAAAVTSSVPEGSGINGFTMFLRTIPYNYYALLTIVMSLFLIFTGTDYCSMKQHEDNARAGDLFTTADRPYGDDVDAEDDAHGHVIDLVAPVLVLIAACIFGLIYTGGFFEGVDFITAFSDCNASAGLVLGSSIALMFTFVFYRVRSVMTFQDFAACIPEGFKAMVSPMLILTLAWTLSGMTNLLGAKYYVANLLGSSAAALQYLLPVIIFLVAVFLAFATGTSWGTFSILIPIVCHAFPQGEMLVVSIAACLSGAVCGDHCSPISDTTIMASAGAHCSHVNHVSTQLPYAITAASCSAACYVITGLTQMFLGSSASLWTSLILLGVAIVLELVVLNILRVKLGKKTKA